MHFSSLSTWRNQAGSVQVVIVFQGSADAISLGLLCDDVIGTPLTVEVHSTPPTKRINSPATIRAQLWLGIPDARHIMLLGVVQASMHDPTPQQPTCVTHRKMC